MRTYKTYKVCYDCRVAFFAHYDCCPVCGESVSVDKLISAEELDELEKDGELEEFNEVEDEEDELPISACDCCPLDCRGNSEWCPLLD